MLPTAPPITPCAWAKLPPISAAAAEPTAPATAPTALAAVPPAPVPSPVWRPSGEAMLPAGSSDDPKTVGCGERLTIVGALSGLLRKPSRSAS